MDMLLEWKNSGFRLFTLQQGQSDELHDHGDYLQVSMPIDNEIEIQWNKSYQRVAAKQRLLVQPDDQHRHLATYGPATIMLVGFQHDFLQEVWENEQSVRKRPALEYTSLSTEVVPLFQQTVQRAFQRSLFEPMDELHQMELEWEVARLFLTLHSKKNTDSELEVTCLHEHPGVKRAIDYMHQEFKHPLTLEEIAGIAGSSKFHFIHQFKRNKRMTPGQYLQQLRIKEAAYLLRSTDWEITRIAYEAGFGSLSSFQRVWKQQYGASASNFRKNV
ncbi:AraC family transcriptional regulator [Brevibacillus laterosporus]|uniref:AraC family transcriptional regulator n=1 Tax=Brevibacillus laterosporus TaxID=1465 RepID=A0A518VD08_BRELA|nr:AraC family transcriptional regulator [Brevibacillus laterosporus]